MTLARAAACQALGRFGDMRAVEPVVRCLGHKHPYVRRAACEALGRLRDARAVEPLVERLGDEYSSVRKAAFQALARLGEGRLAEGVVGAIKGEAEARQELASLAQEGDLRAVEPLIQRLRDRDSHVRQAVFRALESIGKAVKDPHHLFCRSCLARFQQRDCCFEGVGTLSMPVCRLCGRAADAILDVRELVAVLDTEMRQEFSCADGVARVSYLKRDAPFDFDWVEIVRASDYEVERFCVQVGNDTDPFRRGRYRQMGCLVAPGCRLSENTLRILGCMFGQVSAESRKR